ncbi:hypothetical protein PMAYCL1PPCAC_27354, partial [Pristionchus mayeri]
LLQLMIQPCSSNPMPLRQRLGIFPEQRARLLWPLQQRALLCPSLPSTRPRPLLPSSSFCSLSSSSSFPFSSSSSRPRPEWSSSVFETGASFCLDSIPDLELMDERGGEVATEWTWEGKGEEEDSTYLRMTWRPVEGKRMKLLHSTLLLKTDKVGRDEASASLVAFTSQ